MKKYSLLFIVFSFFYSFGQYESIGTVTSFPNKKRDCTFDSTFFYTTDSIFLPIFDEFSSNHFQVYLPDFNNPTLSEEKYYKILTLQGDVIHNKVKYTTQPTFKRQINTQTFEVVEELFELDTVLVSDFCYYPANYIETFVYPPYIIIDTVNFENPLDTIWLDSPDIFQDSATKFFMQVNDPNAYWSDNYAKLNYTNAVLPLSLGVVTFDGLDENNFPYVFGSNSNSYNDYFTSKPIKMGSFTASDSIYLSFLYQYQGFNDEPEINDSLVLEFYAPLLDQWERIWSSSGFPQSDFKVFHHKIIESKYLKDGFQFRLKNYGSEAGMLDEFHLDYVHLRQFSGFQDTLFKDFAIVYPIKTLLKDYTQIPWDHYKNSNFNLMTDSMEVTVRNSSQIVENNQNGSVKIYHNGIEENSFLLNGQILSGGEINYSPRTSYTSYHNFLSNTSFQYDKGKSGKYQEFRVEMNASAQFPNFTQNDSTFFIQRFYDTYAYDDGTAEVAYGPEGVNNARLAYRFSPIEDDSIIGVKISFVPTVVDTRNELFYLTLWDDVNNQPGNVLYQDDFFSARSPSYEYDDSLGFTNYYFKDTMPIPINGTFYIGWKQEGIKRLNIGMDRNIDASNHILYSINNEFSWENTQFNGALLMRPIFSSELNYDLSLDKNSIQKPSFNVFPNPGTDVLNFSTSNNTPSFSIFNLNGQKLLMSTSHSINVSSLSSGLYIIQDDITLQKVKWIKK
ncbi:MAG: T9SS type A sorting domain-containing protein [Flavobacteriia bacterium]|nr:T9SS type A sorting domain-containing protein [Flavobacteriia bacterium]